MNEQSIVRDWYQNIAKSKFAGSVKVILAPTWELAKDLEPEVTVEAEYGANVKEGTQKTLAHHSGKYKGGPAVSTMKPAPLASGTILVSHLDLDTIIACLDLLGKGDKVSDSLREISGFVDVNGPHRLDELNLTEENVDKIHSWWAREEALERKPRDKVSDVTNDVLQAGETLSKIEIGDEEHIQKGKAFRQQGEKLDAGSFVKVVGDVVVRKSDQFVNHLYKHDKKVFKGVAALNTKFNSVTVSLERPAAGVSCRDVVQALWGSEAGGHDGIAGSPRGKVMTEKDLDDAAEALDKAIKGKATQVKSAAIAPAGGNERNTPVSAAEIVKTLNGEKGQKAAYFEGEPKSSDSMAGAEANKFVVKGASVVKFGGEDCVLIESDGAAIICLPESGSKFIVTQLPTNDLMFMFVCKKGLTLS